MTLTRPLSDGTRHCWCSSGQLSMTRTPIRWEGSPRSRTLYWSCSGHSRFSGSSRNSSGCSDRVSVSLFTSIPSMEIVCLKRWWVFRWRVGGFFRHLQFLHAKPEILLKNTPQFCTFVSKTRSGLRKRYEVIVDDEPFHDSKIRTPQGTPRCRRAFERLKYTIEPNEKGLPKLAFDLESPY